MGNIRKELEKSITNAKLDDADAGGLALARLYADLLDGPAGSNPEQAMKLGPKYLDALKALNLTPSTRPAEKGNDGGSQLGNFRNTKTTARTLPAENNVGTGSPTGRSDPTAGGHTPATHPAHTPSVHGDARSGAVPTRGNPGTGKPGDSSDQGSGAPTREDRTVIDANGRFGAA